MYYVKIILKTILWAAVLTGLIVFMAWSVIWCAANVFPQLHIVWELKAISLSAIIVLIVKFRDIFLRYPFYKTFTARRIINAPVEAVWEQLRPRGRNNYYSALVSSIRKVSDNVFRYHLSFSAGKSFTDVKLINEVPYQALEMKYVDEDISEDMMRTTCGFLYVLRPISEDQTEVIVREIHRKPSLFTFYVMEFVGAHRDDLRQLACACEGRQNISWASAQVAMEDISNRPEATLGEVLRPMEEVVLIGLTGIITSLCMIAAWVIF